MGDNDLIHTLLAAAQRLHLSLVEVAALAGVSVPTAQSVMRDGRLPTETRCVRGLTLLAQRAAVARSRADLGLP
jgi:hypothetical protein